MWLVNQAAMGAWWGTNNADPWRTYLTVMYNVVNVGLGAGVQNMVTYSSMQTNLFTDAVSINTNLLINNPILDPAVLDAVFNDPYYGLNNPANYNRWNVL